MLSHPQNPNSIPYIESPLAASFAILPHHIYILPFLFRFSCFPTQTNRSFRPNAIVQGPTLALSAGFAGNCKDIGGMNTVNSVENLLGDYSAVPEIRRLAAEGVDNDRAVGVVAGLAGMVL